MTDQELSVQKKRGRPPGKVRPVTAALRLPVELLERVDRWATSEADAPARPEAVRRLVEEGLSQRSSPQSISADDLNASNDE